MPRTPGLTPLERETVVLFNDAEDTAIISTHQRSILTKLERNPSAKKVEDLTVGRSPGARYEIPKGLISFRTKRATRKPKA